MINWWLYTPVWYIASGKINNEFKLIGEFFATGELKANEYRNITFALGDVENEMQEELNEQNQEIWKSMVFTLMKDDKF